MEIHKGYSVIPKRYESMEVMNYLDISHWWWWLTLRVFTMWHWWTVSQGISEIWSCPRFPPRKQFLFLYYEIYNLVFIGCLVISCFKEGNKSASFHETMFSYITDGLSSGTYFKRRYLVPWPEIFSNPYDSWDRYLRSLILNCWKKKKNKNLVVWKEYSDPYCSPF